MKSVEMVLRCDCGFEARAEHDDELAAAIQRHAWEAHAMSLAPDDARSLAARADALAPLDRVRAREQGRKS